MKKEEWKHEHTSDGLKWEKSILDDVFDAYVNKVVM